METSAMSSVEQEQADRPDPDQTIWPPTKAVVVTVVIPVRDRALLLARAVETVAAQTFKDLEIIIVDDASSIGQIPSHFEVPCRITILKNPTRVGAQRSRLNGSQLATGKYVALLDSDDWWMPNKIEKQLEIARTQEEALLSCRVFAVQGKLRRVAPWRSLQMNEKVEEFLYVKRGMLQTSTIFAKKDIVVSLLEMSADSIVHNDTMLFLEAQRRNLKIIQMSEPLAFFDDDPRVDRISYDKSRTDAAMTLFNQVSTDWSMAAKKGFLLTDMVTRYVNTGQWFKAIGCLIRSYHPALEPTTYLKKVAYVLFNGSPFRFFRRLPH